MAGIDLASTETWERVVHPAGPWQPAGTWTNDATASRSQGRGEAMYAAIVDWFFPRKLRIALFTLAIYAALC